MGLFGKLKEIQKNNTVWMGYSLQNIGTIPSDCLVGLKLNYEDKVLIINCGDNKATIPFDRIVGFNVQCQKNQLNKKDHIWYGSLRYVGKDGSVQELKFREKNTDWKVSQQTMYFPDMVKEIATGNGNGSTVTEL